MTKQNQICDALIKLGHKENTKYPTTKYRVFSRPDGTWYFVGKNGSLRYGDKISDSFSSSQANWLIKKATRVAK